MLIIKMKSTTKEEKTITNFSKINIFNYDQCPSPVFLFLKHKVHVVPHYTVTGLIIEYWVSLITKTVCCQILADNIGMYATQGRTKSSHSMLMC